MKTYAIRLDQMPELLPGLPKQLDDGRRTLKVHRPESARFIQASCATRALPCVCAEVGGAFEIAINCSKAQFEDVRAEFNGRPLR